MRGYVIALGRLTSCSVRLTLAFHIVGLFAQVCSSSMTPLESELLQRLGLDYFHALEQLSISTFLYGASDCVLLPVALGV